MKLSYRARYNRVRFFMKTRQDNDVTNRIGVVYAKTKIKLLGPI